MLEWILPALIGVAILIVERAAHLTSQNAAIRAELVDVKKRLDSLSLQLMDASTVSMGSNAKMIAMLGTIEVELTDGMESLLRPGVKERHEATSP